MITKQKCILEFITPNVEQYIAHIARTCYQSFEKESPESNIRLIKHLIKSGHYPMFDHAFAAFRFITDRGVTHELVRHRIAAYAQESTRYCKYDDICVVLPPSVIIGTSEYFQWIETMKQCEKTYKYMIKNKYPAGIARSVLPTCLKTEIVMSASFTEWLHVIKLRTSKAAHPQIRELITEVFNILHEHAPNIFVKDEA